MTHSGGKPHAVGDHGQRYEVSCFDETKNARIVIGWTDDAASASQWATSVELRPSWKFAWVTDRRPVSTDKGAAIPDCPHCDGFLFDGHIVHGPKCVTLNTREA